MSRVPNTGKRSRERHKNNILNVDYKLWERQQPKLEHDNSDHFKAWSMKGNSKSDGREISYRKGKRESNAGSSGEMQRFLEGLEFDEPSGLHDRAGRHVRILRLGCKFLLVACSPLDHDNPWVEQRGTGRSRASFVHSSGPERTLSGVRIDPDSGERTHFLWRTHIDLAGGSHRRPSARDPHFVAVMTACDTKVALAPHLQDSLVGNMPDHPRRVLETLGDFGKGVPEPGE